MKKSNPTLRQIAEQTGFSQASVSMILSGRDDVSFSEETVRVVKDAADRLGYHRKRLVASSNKRFGKGLIAVFCPNISNPYYSTLLQAIEQSAWAAGFQVFALNTYRSAEAEARYLELIETAAVSGAIFTMRPLNAQSFERTTSRIPTVVIGEKGGDYPIDAVEMDNYGAAVLVARHLIELGHERIAYLSTTLDAVNVIRTQRLRGLEETYASYAPKGSVSIRSRDITPSVELADLFVEHRVGYELAKECLEREEATAFVGVNDMVAYGIMDAIYDAGFSIPRDYSVCGFDNVFPSRLAAIGLTSVDNYIVEKGRNAFAMLSERMARPGSSDADGPMPTTITRVEYPPRLIIRGSTGPIGKALKTRKEH